MHTMWRPRIDRKSGPIYLALARAIAADVQSGRLKAGDRLPPQRELADALRITMTTVTRAYTEAARLGLVNGEVGRGTYVRPLPFAPPQTIEPALIDLSTNELLPQAHGAELAGTLAAIVSRSDPRRLFNYQPHAGSPEHRALAASWLQTLGVPASGADTIITSGAQHAMNVALATLTSPGDAVLCEEVTYTGMRSLGHHLHVRLAGVAMDAEGLIPDALEDTALESGARVVYCMPSVQNPTGRIMSEKRRRDFARVAGRLNLFIVEDDIYGFLAPGLTPLAALAPERTFYLTSLSKSVAPGLRVGFMRPPPGWMDRAVGAVFATTVTAAPLAAVAATTWVTDGTLERVAAWKREEVRARQQIIRAVLGHRVSGPIESQHVWLPLPPAWTADDFAREVRQRGVVVTPAREFAIARHAAPNAVRICLGPPVDHQSLTRALTTIADVLADSPQAFGTSV